jgi:hypothetical protein
VPPLKSTIHTTSSLVSISSPKTIPLRAFKLIPYYLYLTPFLNCVRSSIGNSQRLHFTLQHSTLADYITTYQWEARNPGWCPHVQTKHPSNIYPTILTLPSPKYTLFLLAFRRSDNIKVNMVSPQFFFWKIVIFYSTICSYLKPCVFLFILETMRVPWREEFHKRSCDLVPRPPRCHGYQTMLP